MAINTIMVVDDMSVELENIKGIVSDGGFQTVTANSGKEALEKAKTVKPDLIFMDIVMPEMDGFATCRELSKDETTKDSPVVFVSSKDQQADKVWAQLQGAKAYITKPYSPDQILNQIKKFQ